ncbi:spermatogenesis-associated protein 31D1 isoform X2 [Marmota monax]|uniref:spermatogenesis-associated protein 31D1 isoform X2 n=1 Tax=Marmota monax TaxID=9995 RepID=UPI0026EBFD8F|nr:spermatogenesis-associated protein 31D1 isoform X2 [Marmota monax]XP_058440065.1 spermatogenesis-associated protein 31D1 isoform X2 [Marmota monax]XP_058440066.1 spermatogenesis-associated protein 31D1 isoform X2 [Marmota monax]
MDLGLGHLLPSRRTCRREVEEGRKLLSILKSPMSQNNDFLRFRRLLCPDPLCRVCNRTAAEVSQLICKASLEDALNSVSRVSSVTSVRKSSVFLSDVVSAIPPGASVSTPLTEPTLFPSSIRSPDQITPLMDLPGPSLLGDSLPPEPSPLSSKLPVDHIPPQTSVPTPPPPVPTLPPPTDSQEAKPVLQPEAPLSLVDSPDGLSTNVPTTTCTDSASLPVSEFSGNQSHAENLSPSKLEHSDDDKNLLDLHPPEASFESDTTAILVEPGNLSFLCPDVLALLERHIKKKGDFLMQNKKKKEKKSFPKELKPDDQLNSSGKRLESVAEQQDSPVSLPSQSSEGKSEGLQVDHQSSDPKTFEDNLPKKCTQFFWGLPSLLSESLKSIVPESGDCSTYVCFNSMPSSFEAPESLVLPPPPTLSLPEIQSQPLTQALCQSPVPPQDQLQCQSPVPPQDQFQFSVPTLSPPISSQVSDGGVRIHRFQDEVHSLMPSKIHDLEYNVLQKGQESLWGLPSVVQKSKEEFCPAAPSVLSDRRSSKAYAPTTIIPGDFPLKKELRKKLEHHLQKRLIQHRWGLPCRVHESLSSRMSPETKISEISESKSTYGLSWISLFKGQSSKDLQLSHPRSFHEKSSELLPLGERMKKVNSLEIGTKDDPLSDSEGAPDNDLDSEFKTNLKNELNSLFGKKSKISEESSVQKQLTEALEIHLSKKFEEINVCQMPGTVNRSLHSMEPVLISPEKSPSQTKHRDLVPLVCKDKGLNTSQDISFLGSNKQKILEDHIKLFHKRMMCGLPQKVQESIDIFKMKGTPSWSSVRSNISSSSSLTSGKDSKIGISKPLKESISTFHINKVGTIISGPTLDHPLSATSPVSKENKRALTHSPSHTNPELTENVKAIEGDRRASLPFPHSDKDKDSQKQTVIANKCSPKLPTKQAGARPKSWNKGVSPSNSIEKIQRKIIKNLEYFPMSNKSREIFKAKELCAIRSQSTNSLTTTESESSSVTDMNMNKVESTLTIERPPEGISVLKDSKSLDLKNQLLNELKRKIESRERGLVPAFSTELSLASDKLTSKTLASKTLAPKTLTCKTLTSFTHFHSASSGDMAAPQVLQAHCDNRGINTEQGQEPGIPTHVLCKCQDKNIPLASKRVCPLVPQTGEFGGGDAGLVTRQPRGKLPHPQDRTLKEALGSKSSAPSLKGQPSPENNFKSQFKHFFQRLYLGMKGRGQEGSLKNGSSSSSVQGRNPAKKRAAFTGNTEAQKIMTDIGKILEEKLAGRHGVEATAPQKPLSTPMRPGKIQHKTGLPVQAEPIQKHAFNVNTPCAKVPSAKSCSQEVGFAGQRYPTGNNKWVMDRGRQPQKSVTVQEKICQKHHPSMPHKEPLPHLNTTCKYRVGQVAPAAAPLPKGTVLGELSLLFKQKMLLQNFQKENFLPPK